MNNLTDELNTLHVLFNKGMEAEFSEKVMEIRNTYNSEANLKKIAEFVDKITSELGNMIDEFDIKVQLANVDNMINFSFIAKHYFGKSRNWIYQRINGNIINGKPAKFTAEELNTFNIALKDMSTVLGSVCLR
ncbi:MAG: DUF5053 domain-containing protein [Muribaculaceae bacterium]